MNKKMSSIASKKGNIDYHPMYNLFIYLFIYLFILIWHFVAL